MRWWGSLLLMQLCSTGIFSNWICSSLIFFLFWIQLSKRTCSIPLLFLFACRADFFVFLLFCFSYFFFYFYIFLTDISTVFIIVQCGFFIFIFSNERQCAWLCISGLCILTSVFLGTWSMCVYICLQKDYARCSFSVTLSAVKLLGIVVVRRQKAGIPVFELQVVSVVLWLLSDWL